MGPLFPDDTRSPLRDGLLWTLEVTAASAVLALLLGALLAALRVGPVAALRVCSSWWTGLARHTPPALLLLVVAVGLPRTGAPVPAFGCAALALGGYTAGGIGEVLGTGVRTVALGAGEAARSLGMTAVQSLTLVVLPQAARAVLAPLAALLGPLPRHAALAGAFAVAGRHVLPRPFGDQGYGALAVLAATALGCLGLERALGTVLRRRRDRPAAGGCPGRRA
ncbi:ABC transporter permease subunit, partial [Kitasatospora nipponensis]